MCTSVHRCISWPEIEYWELPVCWVPDYVRILCKFILHSLTKCKHAPSVHGAKMWFQIIFPPVCSLTLYLQRVIVVDDQSRLLQREGGAPEKAFLVDFLLYTESEETENYIGEPLSMPDR